MNQFNWERTFENKNVDVKGLTFNKAILNIVSDIIIHELIAYDERGVASWCGGYHYCTTSFS